MLLFTERICIRSKRMINRFFTDVNDADSPTQRVAGQALAKFKKLRHRTPMLSLSNTFEPQELEYRITALLRRGQLAPTATDDDRREIGDLVVDRRRHEVLRAGARIDLTPLEFQILDLLASEPGRAWKRNDLLDRVWSTEYEGYSRNIDPHINRLRKKLEADPKNPHYVLTVRGVGYKLNENP